MSTAKRTVLITGCSDGGLGAALATVFYEAGLYVYATVRDSSKMKNLASLGIQTLTLDIQSEASIAAFVARLSNLDILVNNAVTTTAVPFQSAYNASKAAIAIFSDSQRLELEPFGITVVGLKNGAVESDLIGNQKPATSVSLPTGSVYQPAREAVEAAMRNAKMGDVEMEASEWARLLVRELSRGKPPMTVRKGAQARLGWVGTFLPHGWLDGMLKKLTGLDVVEQIVRG